MTADPRFIAPATAGLHGTVVVPGDKSVSHRSLIFASLGQGRARIRGLQRGEDLRSTWRCLEALGLDIQDGGDQVVVQGRAGQLDEPAAVLDCGNSGTTMRLLCGLLAAQPMHTVLTGDGSLCRRPMRRVTAPLRALGAHIDGRDDGALAPLAIRGRRDLRAGQVRTTVASAQVKSALLLAAIQGEAPLTLVEPGPSRDHSERMLAAMGADLVRTPLDDGSVRIDLRPGRPLQLADIDVMRDPSSAAFWLVAGSIMPGSRLELPGVGLNPTRTGLLEQLQAMGAQIEVQPAGDQGGEPVGRLVVAAAQLHGVELGHADIVRLVDEVPVLAVAAAFAHGRTVIRGADELRHKESDRIKTTVAMLRSLGAQVEELSDGLEIQGSAGAPLEGNRDDDCVDSHGDHRIAMAAALAALHTRRGGRVRGWRAADVSYPGYFDRLEELRG